MNEIEFKELYKSRNEKESEIKRKLNNKRRIEIEDEEIYNLKEKGLSYVKIAENFKKERNINVSWATIRKRCLKIYENKGKQIPKTIKEGKHKKGITDEEIYNLRQKGLSYREIVEYLKKEKEIDVSQTTISLRCKQIYKEKGEEEPTITGKNRDKKLQITDDEIYNMRKKCLSYREIVEFFKKEKKIDVSQTTISLRCKQIYKEKGEEEPTITGKNRDKKLQITDEEIYNLRELGLKYKEIEQYYKTEKNIDIGYQTIIYRIKKIYKEKGEEEPRITRKIEIEDLKLSDEELFSLREKGMGYEAIVNYLKKEKNVITSVSTIRKLCKKIYREKGKTEPNVKLKRKVDQIYKKIYVMMKQGYSYEEIAKAINGRKKIMSLYQVMKICEKYKEAEIKKTQDKSNKKDNIIEIDI